MRIRNWQQALYAEIDGARARAFSFGTHDCIQFAARCVFAITGVNPAAAFPIYSSEAEAQAIIDAHGDIEGLISSVMGTPAAPLQAGDGDVIISANRSIVGAGICLGQSLAFVGETGLIFRHRKDILKCWRVF